MTIAPRSPSSSGALAFMAAAVSRSTLKVPIRFTRTTVSKGARPAGPPLALDDALGPADPGARDRQAQLAERLDGGRDRGLELTLVGHVGREAHRGRSVGASSALQALGQLLRALAVAVDDRHPRPVVRERPGRGRSEARGAARDRAPAPASLKRRRR